MDTAENTLCMKTDPAAYPAIRERLGLAMTDTDLGFIQRHCRQNTALGDRELLILDVLYRKRTAYPEQKGLRAFYTSDPLAAETYADLMAKASRNRRTKSAYTPQALSDTLSAILRQGGKNISVPTLTLGEDASLRFFEKGLECQRTVAMNGSCVSTGTPTVPPRATASKQVVKNNESLLLVFPGDMCSPQFVEILKSIPELTRYPLCTIGEQGLLHTLTTFEGVYLVLDYLPGYQPSCQSATPPQQILSGFAGSVLITVPADTAITLRDKIAGHGVVSSVIGRLTGSGNLTVRVPDQPPITLPMSLLKELTPILPMDVQIPGMSAHDAYRPDRPASPGLIPDGNCGLFRSTYTTQKEVLMDAVTVSGASVNVSDTQEPAFFRTALHTALEAVANSVAAGASYTQLTMAAALTTASDCPDALAESRTMSALLGLYRVQAEFGIPATQTVFRHKGAQNVTALDVFCGFPTPSVIPSHTFVGRNHFVSLLTPVKTAESPINFEETRSLFDYVNTLCREHVALSVSVVGESGVLTALRQMTQAGVGLIWDGTLPDCRFGFLVESENPLDDSFLGLTMTATTTTTTTTTTTMTTIKDGDVYTILMPDHSLPTVTPEIIPMSRRGYTPPTLCVGVTKAMGDMAPVQRFAKKNNASLKTVMLSRFGDRGQMTELANAMMSSQIAVLTGTQTELETLLSHKRVAFAEEQMLQNEGLLLCLVTDDSASQACVDVAENIAENVTEEPVTNSVEKKVKRTVCSAALDASSSEDSLISQLKTHPFFFGVSFDTVKEANVQLKRNGHEVWIQADCPAVAQMLACGLTYFK